MERLLRTLLMASSLAVAGAFAQQTPAPQLAPAQPMQPMAKVPRGLIGKPYYSAAQFLGVTPAELVVLSRGNKTLAQLATELGKTPADLEAALVTARNQAIDRALQAGRLSVEQANALKASSPAVARAFMNQPVQLRVGNGWGPRGWWR